MIKIINHDGRSIIIHRKATVEVIPIKGIGHYDYTVRAKGFVYNDRYYNWLQRKIVQFLFWYVDK